MKDRSLVGLDGLEQKIRSVIRDAYVYGMKPRDVVASEHGHSLQNQYYYDEKISDWLGDYQQTRESSDPDRESTVYVSMAGCEIVSNPLFQMFHASTISDRSLMLHFYILDFLHGRSASAAKLYGSLSDVMRENFPAFFRDNMPVSERTCNTFLKKYVACGILNRDPKDKKYSLSKTVPLPPADAILFASEQLPLGVIGSYLLSRFDSVPNDLRFKHHSPLGALDSLILYNLILAAGEHIPVALRTYAGSGVIKLIPYKFYFGTQTGRQYVLGYDPEHAVPLMVRVDRIVKVTPLPSESGVPFDRSAMDAFESHIWNVSANPTFTTKHLEMTLHIPDDESYVISRLNREKKHGTVEQIDTCLWKFSIDVYDPVEIMPWIRSFIGRIVDLRCPDDPRVVQRYKSHLQQLFQSYGIKNYEK